MNDAVIRSVRHEVWADTELLKFCASISPEQLAWTAAGTYGTIHNTLQHIVRAQRGYVGLLDGDWDREDVPPDTERLLPVADLIDKERGVGERIEKILAREFDPTRVLKLTDGTVTAGIVLAQFIHHGSDHRAHVGTILGAGGVEPPNLDLWAYSIVNGEGKNNT